MADDCLKVVLETERCRRGWRQRLSGGMVVEVFYVISKELGEKECVSLGEWKKCHIDDLRMRSLGKRFALQAEMASQLASFQCTLRNLISHGRRT